ncbi:RNA-directed DNA polymerase (Reverse transcriptase), Ribonuclease H [Gossypium australe]|uniref:RNA-directed DNA polymerase (Reverse transcriptase), Ribonuclease H n=1 Tax=Gossypium australe TaxID=47621 RepID=A0A5B6WHY0_9ROSI|nr:RNA-directed DNA polymerase (Reverse transcriptase), Ribonuclease H [Gossypium australe]
MERLRAGFYEAVQSCDRYDTQWNYTAKHDESFRQYTQRWRDVATRVQQPLLEKEMIMLFVNTLKASFINHMIGSATKSFSDIVMSREMIKNAIRSGKINAGESAKRSTPRKKENELNTARITRHSIENCIAFKKLDERFIKMGIVRFDGPSIPNVAENPLPIHPDQGVNMIIENGSKRTKVDVVEEVPKGVKSYCEFHVAESHEIHESTEFRALVQSLIDNKELEFFEDMRVWKGKMFMPLKRELKKRTYWECLYIPESILNNWTVEEIPVAFRTISEYYSEHTYCPKPGRNRDPFKAVKGSVIADFLASRALEDYEPLNFNFPNEDLMYVATTKEVLAYPDGDYYPFTNKLDFDCTNNMVEYEECIIGIPCSYRTQDQGTEGIWRFCTSSLSKGEWETRDPKLIDYRKLMADALATLASMVKVNKQECVKPIQMSIYEALTHYYNIKEEEGDDHPWYHDILQYVRNREYPKQTLKRLANEYVLDGEVRYKRRKDQVLLRCVDAVEAKKILEEVLEGVCETHANGFTMARKIMKFGYY